MKKANSSLLKVSTLIETLEMFQSGNIQMFQIDNQIFKSLT